MPPVRIGGDTIANTVAVLSGEKPYQTGGREVVISERGSQAGKQQAREFLNAKLQNLGYAVSEERYATGVNLIGERRGKGGEFVLVTAHLDSMWNSGADDDASGIATAVAILEALANIPLDRGIRFVAFDEEERGLVGSRNLADNWAAAGRLSEVIAVFNIEMTGYDGDNDGAIHAIHCNENSSAQLADLVQRSIGEGGLELDIVSACTNRSDHASFWRHDVPAIVVSQNFFGNPADANPCYHRSCDRFGMINFNYAESIANALLIAMYSLVAN